MKKFDYQHYVPSLKWRQGEYRALSTLVDDVKDAITPLIEIPGIPHDFEEELSSKDSR